MISLIKKAIDKLIIGPIKYKSGSSYKSEAYWEERFKKYGGSLKAVGNEGDSEADNVDSYRKGVEQISAVLDEFAKVDTSTRVLEIGVGQGSYTQVLHDRSPGSYTGVDVTDYYFGELSGRFPGFKFIKRNAGVDTIEGEFDLVVMIDVIEHIVDNDQMRRVMENIESVLVPGGHFVITGFGDEEKKKLFYVKHWTLDNLKSAFRSMEVIHSDKFRKKNVAVFRKG